MLNPQLQMGYLCVYVCTRVCAFDSLLEVFTVVISRIIKEKAKSTNIIFMPSITDICPACFLPPMSWLYYLSSWRFLPFWKEGSCCYSTDGMTGDSHVSAGPLEHEMTLVCQNKRKKHPVVESGAAFIGVRQCSVWPNTYNQPPPCGRIS